MSHEDTVRAYWDAANSRDWVAFAGVLAADVRYRIPQTGERVTGRERYVRFNETYPGEWSIQLERLVSSGDHAASWISFDVVEGQRLTAVTFFRFATDGLITEIDDFWPEPYDAPLRPEGVMDA